MIPEDNALARFQYGNRADRVLRKEGSGLALAAEDRDRHDIEVQAQMGGEQAHLQAVLRGPIVEEAQGVTLTPPGRSFLSDSCLFSAEVGKGAALRAMP